MSSESDLTQSIDLDAEADRYAAVRLPNYFDNKEDAVVVVPVKWLFRYHDKMFTFYIDEGASEEAFEELQNAVKNKAVVRNRTKSLPSGTDLILLQCKIISIHGKNAHIHVNTYISSRVRKLLIQ